MKKYCVNCGKALNSDGICTNCDSKEKNTNSNNGLAIAGFTLSIISSVLCCGIFNLVSLGLSIAGLFSNKKTGKGFAICGIIISLIPILLFILILFLRFIGSAIYVPFTGFEI